MGFARLHFDADGTETIGGVVRDIVGVIAGDVTATSGLTSATQNLSYIYNSAGRGNWTKVYPATLGTTIPQVLSAACLNGQTKFIQIGGIGVNDSIGNTIAADRYISGTAANDQGVYIRSCTAATSATAVSNPSYNNGSNGTMARINYFTGTYFFISWSSRHCLIIGSEPTNGWIASGCFEFNEDGIHDYRNVAPFCHIGWFSNSIDTTTTPATVQALNAPSTHQVMNHFRPDTAVALAARNILGEFYGNTIVNNAAWDSGIITKNSSGAASIYLQPFFWHQHQMGVPHHYISDLCKVYRARSTPGEPGDTMTIGADTYVYVPLSSTTLDVGLACLRA